MDSIKSIILILISIFIFSILSLEVSASHSFNYLERKIHSWSNSDKITKMQLALADFWIYSGKIDWDYNSVKKSLIDYQRSTWITKHLWYFWRKTLTALKKDYPNKFEEITNKYLKIPVPSTEVRDCIVTAYYSPIPGQDRYSYSSKLKRYRTYAEAVRMQWKWTHWKSGKAVHVWFIAAPENYQFWTKIELEWLWVWVVEDRWQAIVNAWERKFENDRIDVWMWYGDEWRIRADRWWVRTIKWQVVSSDREVTMEFNNSFLNKYSKLKVDAEKPKKENVIKLQELLIKANEYKWPIDWKFNSVKDTLIKFQIDNNIIKSKNDPHAWYFWNKTYLALKDNSWGGLFKSKSTDLEGILLSKDTRRKLDLLSNKINKIVIKKYWKNTPKAIKYKKNLKNIIDRQIVKIKNKERKKHLKYLKSII